MLIIQSDGADVFSYSPCIRFWDDVQLLAKGSHLKELSPGREKLLAEAGAGTEAVWCPLGAIPWHQSSPSPALKKNSFISGSKTPSSFQSHAKYRIYLQPLDSSASQMEENQTVNKQTSSYSLEQVQFDNIPT